MNENFEFQPTDSWPVSGIPSSPSGDDVTVNDAEKLPGVLGDEGSSVDDHAEHSGEQVAVGDLTQMKFATSAELDEEVPTDRIIHFLGIPDYLTKTISPLPILVRIADDLHCIDGWEWVEDALRGEQEKLLSRVKYLRIPTESDLQTELAILKTAVRVRKQGGHADYAELVANVMQLYSRLEAGTVSPLVYGRGCARTQGQSENNRAENVRWVLHDRLGKDQNTVSQYLNHARHLPEGILAGLVVAKAAKRVFEKIVIRRNEMRSLLQEQQVPQADIEPRIATLIVSIVEQSLEQGLSKFDTIADQIIAGLAPARESEEPASPTTIAPISALPERLEESPGQTTTKDENETLQSGTTTSSTARGVQSLKAIRSQIGLLRSKVEGIASLQDAHSIDRALTARINQAILVRAVVRNLLSKQSGGTTGKE
jgi:hypothetical protein